MEWIETTGQNVEEAKQKALEILGLAEREAEFEVLAEEKTGLFGRVRSEARVRARVKPRQVRRKSSRQRNNNRRPKERKESVKEGRNMESQMTHEQLQEIIVPFMEGLLETLGREAEIKIETDDEVMEVRVVGDNLGVLIGPRGNVLSCLYDVINTVVQRNAKGARYPRIRLDVGDYRRKRREALAKFAKQLAEEARDTSKEIVLEPMNAADRKIVHDTVSEIEEVSTMSEGEDSQRRVVIIPDK